MLAALVAVSMGLSGPGPVAEDCTRLQQAILQGQTEVVRSLAGRRLLGFVPPTDELERTSSKYGMCSQMTPLMIAVRFGHLEIAKILIGNGARVNQVSPLSDLGYVFADARCIALSIDRQDLVALLDRHGAQAGECTEVAELFRLVAIDDAEGLKRQLALGSQLTTEKLLGALISRRVTGATDLLIQRAMNENLDFTRLYEQAIVANAIEFVQKLSDSGARAPGERTLALAIVGRHTAMIKPLIAAGASATKASEAILDTIKSNDREMLRALLDNDYRGDDQTPLLLTAIVSQPGLVPELLRPGISVEADDAEGITPLMMAAWRQQTHTVKLLLKHGASRQTGDLDCLTASAYAMRSRNDELVALLMFSGPIVPGRMASRQGITCGGSQAVFPQLRPTEQVRIRAKNGDLMLPLRHDKVAHLSPGLLTVDVLDLDTEKSTRRTILIEPGANTFQRMDLGLTGGMRILGDPSIENREIKALVEGRRPDLDACVVAQNKRAPEVHGSMGFDVEVGQTGRVVVRMIQDGPPALVRCVSTVARKWNFGGRMIPAGPALYKLKY